MRCPEVPNIHKTSSFFFLLKNKQTMTRPQKHSSVPPTSRQDGDEAGRVTGEERPRRGEEGNPTTTAALSDTNTLSLLANMTFLPSLGPQPLWLRLPRHRSVADHHNYILRILSSALDSLHDESASDEETDSEEGKETADSASTNTGSRSNGDKSHRRRPDFDDNASDRGAATN